MIDIGDFVRITNPGLVYKTYWELYKKLGVQKSEIYADLRHKVVPVDGWRIVQFAEHEENGRSLSLLRHFLGYYILVENIGISLDKYSSSFSNKSDARLLLLL